MRTDDGGSTWNTEQLPSGAETLDGIACPSESFCLAVGTDAIGAITLTYAAVPPALGRGTE